MFSGTCNGIKIEIPYPNHAECGKFGLAYHGGFDTGFETNQWEPCEIRTINKYLPRDTDVVEFGAGSGYISCFTNKLISGKRHIVFEANPLLLPIIENNRDINGCDFEVVSKAYATLKSSVDYPVTNPIDNIVAATMPVVFKVDAVSLGDVVEEYKLDCFSLIMDIESSEFDIVNETSETLEKCKMMIIEIHIPGQEAGHRGFDNSADINGFLLGNGFKLRDNCGCANRNYVYVR